MIRINLSQKKQASYVSGTKGSSSQKTGLFSGASKSGASIAPLIGKMVIPLLLCAAGYFGFDYYIGQRNMEMQREVDTAGKERDTIQNELKRIQGFEVVKTELEKNQLILRTKIETIEKLIRGRDLALKSLVALSQSLPKEVWLTELSLNDTGYVIKGGSTEMSLITDAMTHLGQSIYFKDVNLQKSQNDSTGHIALFELTARRQ